MTTLTLTVPEDLAVQCAQRDEHLSQLLALELFPAELPLAAPVASAGQPVGDDMLDFLAMGKDKLFFILPNTRPGL